ncbi:TLC domain-containing protein 1 isoform X2 [Meles meles]|uniref:TLC domain-containing protein 1 isoform X2 n=1 Tax=Meles meles TaxID=9662 RepID=UPI001E69FA62|nr:TLC domain-containing protein 1 isoform X2 [Meles meles]
MPPLLHPALPLLLGATLTFRALRRALSRLPLPEHVRADPLRTWRWHNLLVSFAHSIVSGVWAVLCLWQTPEMLVEIETAWSLSGYLLACFSAGYFIHDTVDIVISRQTRASWEYLVHHVMALGAFFAGIFWNSFVGGGVLTLLVEVSNIFLTIRMMMKINNAQHLLLYRVNKLLPWTCPQPATQRQVFDRVKGTKPATCGKKSKHSQEQASPCKRISPKSGASSEDMLCTYH